MQGLRLCASTAGARVQSLVGEPRSICHAVWSKNKNNVAPEEPNEPTEPDTPEDITPVLPEEPLVPEHPVDREDTLKLDDVPQIVPGGRSIHH